MFSDKINLRQRELEVCCQKRTSTTLIASNPRPGGVFQGDRWSFCFESRSETRLLLLGFVLFDDLAS